MLREPCNSRLRLEELSIRWAATTFPLLCSSDMACRDSSMPSNERTLATPPTLHTLAWSGPSNPQTLSVVRRCTFSGVNVCVVLPPSDGTPATNRHPASCAILRASMKSVLSMCSCLPRQLDRVAIALRLDVLSRDRTRSPRDRAHCFDAYANYHQSHFTELGEGRDILACENTRQRCRRRQPTLDCRKMSRPLIRVSVSVLGPDFLHILSKFIQR
jgi:hypothetical protein